MAISALEEVRAQVGRTYTSPWITVDQPMIDAFADTTRDWNFLHVDPDKAKAAGFGGTIAHGFLTLSLLATMRHECDRPDVSGFRAGVNYGLERVRMLAPVPSGCRIRGVMHVATLEERNPGHWLETMDVTVEIEGQDKPALIARWLTMYLE